MCIRDRVYRRHYSADNCCITLYGKMDMADKLARLDKDLSLIHICGAVAAHHIAVFVPLKVGQLVKADKIVGFALIVGAVLGLSLIHI